MTHTASDAQADAIVAAVQSGLDRHAGEQGGLLPVLHDVQERLGCIPRAAVPLIAEGLNLSRAEVHGVVTYYHFFRSEPPGRHLVQICRAEACQAMGANRLVADAEQLLGCKLHTTRSDGEVTLEPVFCLGLCALSPAVTVDDQPLARMTAARLKQLASGWKPAP
jgi:formate dehydrogenase subunit gamma